MTCISRPISDQYCTLLCKNIDVILHCINVIDNLGRSMARTIESADKDFLCNEFSKLGRFTGNMVDKDTKGALVSGCL